MIIFRIIRQFIVLLLVKLPVQLIGIPIVAIALLFHLKDRRYVYSNLINQRLPRIFQWFDNGDEIDRKYGLNGDLGFKTKFLYKTDHALSMAEMAVKDSEEKEISRFKIYLMRLTWLALRNPANYFQHNVLGVKTSDLKQVIRFDNFIFSEGRKDDDLEVGDYPSHYQGIRNQEVELKDGSKAWEYYIVKNYSFWKGRAFRARIGYKLGHYPMIHYRPTVQWVCNVNPFSTSDGK